jgi:hypothetical protein
MSLNQSINQLKGNVDEDGDEDEDCASDLTDDKKSKCSYSPNKSPTFKPVVNQCYPFADFSVKEINAFKRDVGVLLRDEVKRKRLKGRSATVEEQSAKIQILALLGSTKRSHCIRIRRNNWTAAQDYWLSEHAEREWSGQYSWRETVEKWSDEFPTVLRNEQQLRSRFRILLKKKNDNADGTSDEDAATLSQNSQ